MKRHILFAALLLAGSAQAAPLHPVFQVDPYWPKALPHGYVFGSSGGVTVDGVLLTDVPQRGASYGAYSNYSKKTDKRVR